MSEKCVAHGAHDEDVAIVEYGVESKPNDIVDAVTVDTNVFINSNFGFNAGALSWMSFFADSDIVFIIPDVIKEEVIIHYSSFIEDNINSLKKPLKKLKGHILDFADDIGDKVNGMSKENIRSLAESSIEKYFSKMSCSVICSNEFVSVENILKQYFKCEPPFGVGKNKKAEFPDAIAIDCIEGWAKKNNKKVLVFSDDKGWIKRCDQSEYLICKTNIEKSLDKMSIKSTRDMFLDILKGCIDNKGCVDLESDISVAIVEQVEIEDREIECSSFTEYDIECELFDCYDVRFEPLDNESLFYINTKSNVLAHVACVVSATIKVECLFSFRVWDGIDKDYVELGSRNITVEQNAQFDVTFNVFREDAVESMIEVEDIVINKKSLRIEVGTVDPFERDYEEE